ncbi:MAG: DUF115 domain-containing protein [Candidatus Lokiarchaeota archaeon]|nr:DUF115 domain-containing protein [Candidatus Lokiarchaeota archaeon]
MDIISELIKDNEFRDDYMDIIRKLHYSETEDQKARELLRNIILLKKGYSLEFQINNIKNKIERTDTLFIFGGGPGTDEFCNLHDGNPLILQQTIKNSLVIAVDGALGILNDYNIQPEIIFTDLDGIQLNWVQKPDFANPIMIIHAHGDNMEKIKKFRQFVLNYPGIIGTTQSQTHLPIINHGGFTDGDRTLYLIDNFLENRHSVYLIGFEFGKIVGKHSKPYLKDNITASETKKQKLKFGRKFTEKICLHSDARFLFLEFSHPVKTKSTIIKIHNLDDLLDLFK